MTQEKMYTLVFTESQLDTIFDALTELANSSDDENELTTIAEVDKLIYEVCKKD